MGRAVLNMVAALAHAIDDSFLFSSRTMQQPTQPHVNARRFACGLVLPVSSADDVQEAWANVRRIT